jgi:hypothetical protein
VALKVEGNSKIWSVHYLRRLQSWQREEGYVCFLRFRVVFRGVFLCLWWVSRVRVGLCCGCCFGFWWVSCFFFLLSWCSFCILSVYLGAPHAFLIKFDLLIKKEDSTVFSVSCSKEVLCQNALIKRRKRIIQRGRRKQKRNQIFGNLMKVCSTLNPKQNDKLHFLLTKCKIAPTLNALKVSPKRICLQQMH